MVAHRGQVNYAKSQHAQAKKNRWPPLVQGGLEIPIQVTVTRAVTVDLSAVNIRIMTRYNNHYEEPVNGFLDNVTESESEPELAELVMMS